MPQTAKSAPEELLGRTSAPTDVGSGQQSLLPGSLEVAQALREEKAAKSDPRTNTTIYDGTGAKALLSAPQ